MSTEFPTTAEISSDVLRALKATGVDPDAIAGGTELRTPITGEVILSVRSHTDDDVDAAVAEAAEAFTAWREVPAPVRGQLVKRWGELLAEHKEDLATLVTAEVGKITSEALGEVQEMIDITDLAVGQSRQLFGKTMPSERPGHRLMETWHPLGVVGIISAFNFPVAVYAWNTALALVAGDTVVWKPAEATLLSALATDALLAGPRRTSGRRPGSITSCSVIVSSANVWWKIRVSRWCRRPDRSGWAGRSLP
jgi:aldehyde dehydrogenase (NAD+)